MSGRNAAQGPAQDIETILSNEGPFATKPHGWFAVVNNKGRASNGDDHHAKLVLDRREERAFFDITPPYNRGRFRPLCGVENLIQKLSRYVLIALHETAIPCAFLKFIAF